MQHTSFDRGIRCLCGLLWLTTAGCGNDLKTFDRVAVEGTVALDGAPVDYGAIVLAGPQDAAGESAKCSVQIQNGRFTALAAGGPAVGENRVTINVFKGAPPAPPQNEDDEVPEPELLGTWTGTTTVVDGEPVKIDIPSADVLDGNDRPLKRKKSP